MFDEVFVIEGPMGQEYEVVEGEEGRGNEDCKREGEEVVVAIDCCNCGGDLIVEVLLVGEV